MYHVAAVVTVCLLHQTRLLLHYLRVTVMLQVAATAACVAAFSTRCACLTQAPVVSQGLQWQSEQRHWQQQQQTD